MSAARFQPGAHVTLTRTVCSLHGGAIRRDMAVVEFDTGLKVYLVFRGEQRVRQAPRQLVTEGWTP